MAPYPGQLRHRPHREKLRRTTLPRGRFKTPARLGVGGKEPFLERLVSKGGRGNPPPLPYLCLGSLYVRQRKTGVGGCWKCGGGGHDGDHLIFLRHTWPRAAEEPVSFSRRVCEAGRRWRSFAVQGSAYGVHVVSRAFFFFRLHIEEDHKQASFLVVGPWVVVLPSLHKNCAARILSTSTRATVLLGHLFLISSLRRSLSRVFCAVSYVVGRNRFMRVHSLVPGIFSFLRVSLPCFSSSLGGALACDLLQPASGSTS